MTHRTNGATGDDNAAPTTESGHRPGLLSEIVLLEQALRGALHERINLAGLETRQAGERLVGIFVMGLLTAGILLSAWLALAGAIVITLVQRSLLTTSSALMVVAGLHLLISMMVIATIRRRSVALMFPATVGSFRGPPPPDKDAAPSA